MPEARRIRVGIIGASPERGWAFTAHIPALRALPQFELVAISTSRAESAEAARRQLGVAHAFDNHAELLALPDVDLVAICVKVPHHAELVAAAIAAGKAVYCEWPLGNGLAEAERLAALARDAGIVARVGLQARASPVIGLARQMIADGYVGKVLSTSVIGSGVTFGATIAGYATYLLDERNGASMLTIPFGHSVDALCWCLGEFGELSATLATRRTRVAVIGENREIDSSIADQVAVTGVLTNGAVASIHFRGGTSRGTNFLWEINGTEGDLVVEGSGGLIQMMPLRIRAGRGGDRALSEVAVPVDPIAYLDPQAPPYNVAQTYLRVGRDMIDGGARAPTFDDAVVRHRMIAAIVEASRTGSKQSYDPVIQR